MKSLTLVAALVLVGCSSPSPAPGPSGGGSGGGGPQAITAPAVDSRILGAWDFTGQIRGSDIIICGRDVTCDAERLTLSASGGLIMESPIHGKVSCTFTTANEQITYKCGNNSPVTNDYGFSDSGVTLCIWQNAGLAYCYTHR